MERPATPPRFLARMEWWILAAPLVFLIHDSEELLTMERWLRDHRDELPAVVRSALGVTMEQFAVAVLVLFVAIVVAAAHGAHRARQGRGSLIFLVVAGMLVGNALTHLAQAAFFRGYTPGVLTAALLVLPWGYSLGRRLQARHLATRRGWLLAIAIGVVAQLPIAALVLLSVS